MRISQNPVCLCLYREHTIAPGQYHFEKDPEGPAYTMLARKAGLRPDIPSVGPGEYEIDKSVGCGPAWTMRGKPEGKVRYSKKSSLPKTLQRW
jgi:hypothetical protein